MTRAEEDAERVVGGRYRLHEQVGAGPTGPLWRGEDVAVGRPVTVEQVAWPAEASDADRADFRDRIRQTSRVVAELDHPGAVPVLDVVEDAEASYVVRQHVEGTRLSEVITRDGLLSPQRAALIGLAVLAVLRAAHARGVLHRDVKPATVLLTPAREGSPGRVLLTDFGVAQAVGDATFAGTGLLIGSPGYTAPERARGGSVGPASDIWSLGATLFTAVEGHPPYQGDGADTTLVAVARGRQEPYVRAGPLEPVLTRMLHPDPARRITSGELEQELGDVATSRAAASTAAPRPRGPAVPDAVARTAVLQLAAPGPTAAAAGSREPATPPRAPASPPREPATPPRAPAPPPRAPATPRREPGAHRRGAHAATASGAGRRHPARRRRRTRWALLAGLLAAAVLGVVLAFVWAGRGPDADAVAARGPGTEETSPASGVGGGAPLLAPPPPAARTPAERLSATIPALTEAAERSPDAVGPRAGEVLERLRQVDALDGPAQRSTAIATEAFVDDAVQAGELDAGVGGQVQRVLGDVARPGRLVDLVQMLDHDRLAVGPDGPAVFDQLFDLDHSVPADQTAARAATVLQSVTARTEQGRLTEAFERAAGPMLEALSDPAPGRALDDLLARAERDPAAVGPASQDVVAALREMQTLPVYGVADRAAQLLERLGQDGQVTPAFRDAAVPVLTALVR